MSRFSLKLETTEQELINKIETLKKISALIASKILKELKIYDSLQRPRSPEEVFHMNNYIGLEKEFHYIFEILADMKLLEKQGEFYQEGPTRISLEKKYQTEILEENNDIFGSINYLFEKISSKYISILKGEQGKLNSKELINFLDCLHGSEFVFMIRELFFKQLTTRVSIFSETTKLNILNWGVGSGYDAVHIADFFGLRASIISIEPDNEVYRGKVLQDLYEIYNLDFVERSHLEISLLSGTIDLFFGNGIFFFESFSEIVKVIKKLLKDEGFLALIINKDIDLATKWVFSVFDKYKVAEDRDSLIAKFKHSGLSRVKYVGLNDSFVLLQK
ncbi:MAG: hypothetical protein K9W45_13245 [Candidatus Heimdallarchaeum aukensis]|uniref:Methyltransferase domain-containing protein n=1 Tax=Candidatus Heimdallarchaeum aukensis TaxID=2876573 RepID=A0A9Y1BKN4_9ARCH|nr:MAG: hypothetical protein K9W45_13245 [Candidatus Heimdallarchaeum aukensis]